MKNLSVSLFMFITICSYLHAQPTCTEPQSESFTVLLPLVTIPPDEEGQGWDRPNIWGSHSVSASADEIEIPNGRPIYALIVSGYSSNAYLDELMLYNFARFLMDKGAYVHFSWWNNLLAPYMERPLHSSQSDPGGSKADLISFTTVASANNKAVPGEDYQFVSDAKRMLVAIRENNPNAIIIVAGHSMGGGAIIHLAQQTNVLIDILAPIDPVGNRNFPFAGTGRINQKDFNWTRWRVSRNNFLGYRDLAPSFSLDGCVPSGDWLPEPPSDLVTPLCPGFVVHNAPTLTFGKHIVNLHHRYQQEASFPFDYDEAYHFGHNAPPGGTTSHSGVATKKTGTFDPGGLPPGYLPGTCCPLGNGTGWDDDGHGEIIGRRGNAPVLVALGVKVGTSPECSFKCSPLIWPARSSSGLGQNISWNNGNGNARQEAMRALENLPLNQAWAHEPFNPDLCLVSAGLIGKFNSMNKPPVANAGGDRIVECMGSFGAMVTLDGSGSNDSDNDDLTYIWTGDIPTQTGVSPTLELEMGSYCIKLTVTDPTGHQDTDHIFIEVADSPPDIVANPIEVYLDADGRYVLDQADLEKMAEGTTDCLTPFEELKLLAYPRIFKCDNIGETIHTRLTVEDTDGKIARAWTTVTVMDTLPPTAVCQDLVVYLSENGDVVITPEEVNNESFDNCGIESLELNTILFDCADVGENTVTLTVTDSSGNSAVCTGVISVHDTLAPIFETLVDLEVDVENGVTETAVEYPEIIVLDNCPVEPELIGGLGPDGVFPVGSTTEVWAVIDGELNADTLTFVVKVSVMNARPTIDAIADVTADEDDSPVIVSLTGISDGDESVEQVVTVTAVSNNPDLVETIVAEYAGGGTGSLEIHLFPDMNGVAEITITVEDSEGVSVTEIFTITVNPVNDPPFVVNPIADQVVNASYVLKVPVSPELGELFDDPEGDELTISAMPESGEPLPDWVSMVNDSLVFSPMIADTGCVNIVVMATDQAGAIATDTFQLCVDGYPVSTPTVDAQILEVTLYPNPARDWVNLEINKAVSSTSEVTVYNITGQQIIRRNFTDNQNISFNMENRVSGMYFVKLNLEGKEIVKKLVLNRK